jgi:hypothetical protein
MLELLSTIYIGKPLLAQIVLEPLLTLISRNQTNHKFVQFIENILLMKALSSVITLKQQKIALNPAQLIAI